MSDRSRDGRDTAYPLPRGALASIDFFAFVRRGTALKYVAVVVEVPIGDNSSPEKEDSEAKRIREEWLKRNKEDEERTERDRKERDITKQVIAEEPEPVPEQYMESDEEEHVHEKSEHESLAEKEHHRARTDSIDSATEVFHDAPEIQDDVSANQDTTPSADVPAA